jgi:THAP domain-containing protein 4
MTDKLMNTRQILSLLKGSWTGEGRGEFPGVTSFDYRETLTFTRRDEKTLAYEQRAQKRYDGQTEYLQSHWENGFISILENNDLQLVNIQIGGRSEVLVGSIESLDALFRIHFVSKALANDPRMISSARTFELEGDTLRYEMGMHTTKVEGLTPHLKIALQRVKQ